MSMKTVTANKMLRTDDAQRGSCGLTSQITIRTVGGVADGYFSGIRRGGDAVSNVRTAPCDVYLGLVDEGRGHRCTVGNVVYNTSI